MNNNNIKNPFIGLRTYEESDAIFFRGRKSSTSDLYNMISDNDVVVLHAESGEGKSSLLNAGLFPMLRDERFFPIKISFTEEDYALENPDFDKIIYQRIVESVNQINGDSTNAQVFRNGLSLDGKISILPIEGENNILSENEQLRQCAWWLLRNYTLNAYGASLIPVLVFDQFEEVFTRPKSNTWTEDFFTWLSSTLNDTVPQNVVDIVREVIGEAEEFPRVRTEKKFKALFSLRTEYMGELDYWGIQRHHISVLKNSRYCLKPLTEQEADEVLELQPVFTPQIRTQIKEAIRSSHGSKRVQMNLPAIPAMLLSVVSTTATNNIAQNGQAFDNVTAISDTDLSSDLFTNIIDQFYQKEITTANIPKKVIKHIEDVLVDDKGKRVRIKADSKELRKLDFEVRYKPLLEQMRLIKCTQINGDEYVELTHDALAKVITKRRDIKQIDRSRWTNYVLNGSFCLIVLLAIVYWFSLLAKGYIYGGYDAMREYHYIATNLFKKILISCGFIPIIYWGYKQYHNYHNSTKLAPKIRSIILSYIFASIYYFSILYIIIYLEYPNHTWISNGVLSDRILWQMAFVVGGSIMILVGYLLIQWKKYIRSLRWPLVIGIPIMIGALSPYIDAISPIVSYLLITYAIFYCVSCVFKKEKQSYLLFLLAIGLIILSNFLYSPYGNLPKYCIIGIVALILGYIIFALKQRNGNSFIYLLKSNDDFKQNKLISALFGIYNIAVIGFISVSLGYKLNDLYSILGLITISPLLIYLVYSYIIPIKNNSQKYILYTICILGVIAIWLVQFTYWHFWGTVIIWVLGILSIISTSYHLSKSEYGNNIKLLLKSIRNPLIIFVFVVGFMPFLIMGYNVVAFNNYTRVSNHTVYIMDADTKLMYVKNNNGKLGIMNRMGRIVIPADYDTIMPIYQTSYNSSWSDDYSYRTHFYGFSLIKGWQIDEWLLKDHLWIDRLCSDNEMSKIHNSGNINYSIEENRIKELIVNLIKHNNDSISHINNWRFNHKDINHLRLLNEIQYDTISPNLIATSENFREFYLDTIVPNLAFGKFGLGKDILSPTYQWDRVIQVISNGYKKVPRSTLRLSFSNTNNPQEDVFIRETDATYISDNVSEEMVVKRDAGYILSNVIYYNLISGRFKKAEELSLTANNISRYNEINKVYYLIALLLQNKKELALEYINHPDNQIISLTSSIFPEEENSQFFRHYFITSDLLGTIKLPSIYTNELKRLIDSNIRLQIQDVLPFDNIYLVKDDESGKTFRFTKSFSLPNCRRTYSYYVKDNKRITPPFSFWSYPLTNGDPVLAINCMTKKRQFINYKSSELTPNIYEQTNEDGTSFKRYIYSNKLLQGYIAQCAPTSKYTISRDYYVPNDINGLKEPDIIKGEYVHAWPFSEGLAAVEINGKIGFINTSGDVVIKPQFSAPFSIPNEFYTKFYGLYRVGNKFNPYFRNGKCPVYNDKGELTWIDTSGSITTPPMKLPSIGRFGEYYD